MTDPSALTGDEREVWGSFYAMRRSLDRALDLQLQRDSQISASEYEILLAINDSPEQQLRIKELAGTIGWEKSRVSHLITRMEKRGLVDRTECESDARGSWIGMTDEGRAALLGAMSGHVAAIRRYFFDILEADEAAGLADVSGRVMSAIGCAADEDVPAGERPDSVAVGS